jgi:hypothetical protein
MQGRSVPEVRKMCAEMWATNGGHRKAGPILSFSSSILPQDTQKCCPISDDQHARRLSMSADSYPGTELDVSLD